MTVSPNRDYDVLISTRPPFMSRDQHDLGSWWTGTRSSAPAPVLAVIVALAALGALSLVNEDGAGLGLTLTGLGMLAVPLTVSGPQALIPRLTGAALVAALWSVVAVRDAGWIVTLCVLAAIVATGMTLVPARRFTGLFMAAVAAPLGVAGTILWTFKGVRRLLGRYDSSGGRLLRMVVISLGLLVVFGGLFAAADVAFATLVESLVPLSLFDLAVPRGVVFVALLCAGCLWSYLAASRPRVDAVDVPTVHPASRFEWSVPLIVLNSLFVVFVAVQARAFFGGDEYVQRTAGLSYAEYARGGFWQLSMVTGLSLAVIAVAAWKAPRAARTDRLVVRLLLGGLCLLSLVVVASAMYRMNLYSQAYGLTRLRVWVFAVEGWLSVVFAMVLACGWRLRAGWLPRAVMVTGIATLVGLAAINPDALVAEQNIARFEQTGKIDLNYLSQLSADAVPQLTTLPATERGCVFAMMAADTSDGPLSWNLGRARAAETLTDRHGADISLCTNRI
jgi:hypothetical protein